MGGQASQYHVFFECDEKGVSSALVLDRRLERMVEEMGSSGKRCPTMEMANQARKEELYPQ
jgi:hypothetical protein